MRWLALFLLPGVALADPSVPVFVPETGGLTATYDGDYFFMVGGGPAVFDCSGDRKPDVYVPGGAGQGSLWRNDSALGGALAFSRVDSGAELADVTGAYPLDIDGDGLVDLVLMRLGETQLLRGMGDCRFQAANDLWGFRPAEDWTTAFAATWEAGADWPTLALGAYIDPRQESFPWGSCTDNLLYRGQAGRFDAPLPLAPSFCALSMLFTDWNRSGHPSLRVSNDREYYKGGQEQMWHLDPGQPPRLWTEAEGWKRLRIWGMGIATADVTQDGYPDYFLTSMADNKLQVLKDAASGLPDYADVAFKRGATAHRPYTGDDLRPSTAWHAEFGDVNNDGRADLYVVKGNVAKMPDFAAADPNNLLLQAPDGAFVEAGDRAGVASVKVGRGGALVDLNLDGALDMIAVNRWEGTEVWRQEAPLGAWVQLRLAMPGPNRDAIGAVVETRRDWGVERREVFSGGGHAGGQLGWLHLGLGTAAQVELRVIWPGGAAGDWLKLPAGTFQQVTPGGAVVWAP
ncbi:MAG: CRTAC1 family protein [Elusimicrobia bacterium]|nr:MAG: CRTAC1 family protein [Elusimicrobiota bacterium]